MKQKTGDDSAVLLKKIDFLIGSEEIIYDIPKVPVREPFGDDICEFMNLVSKIIMKDPKSKEYPDVITLGFWLRKASVMQMKERYGFSDKNVHIGRGVIFHIAPSNVAVNFAYSLFTGLLSGNKNIVRVPSKKFPQIDIIVKSIKEALDIKPDFAAYIVLVRYERDKEINDLLSSVCDVRVIWGGDSTIAELRRSPLNPRATEITFADRFSFSVIDSDAYMEMIEKKEFIAKDFFNDTYLTDQNACTSPRLVVWTGNKKESAKSYFWSCLSKLLEKEYELQPIMAVNKLNSSYLAAINKNDISICKVENNLITRVKLGSVSSDIIDMRESCGYFFEYDTDDLADLKELCCDNRVQTVSVLGDGIDLSMLFKKGINGIDRIVPIGHTMDFDLIWDGYNLVERMTRTVAVIK